MAVASRRMRLWSLSGPMTLFAHAYKTVSQVSSSPRASARNPTTSLLGTHLLALRAPLLAVAKGWWLTQPDESTARVARAVDLICADRQQGRQAMLTAAKLGEMPVAREVAERFAEARQSLEAEAGIA